MTIQNGKSKKAGYFFFDTSLIFPSLFSFNIIENRKKKSYSSGFSKKKYIFAIELRISKGYIDMKKEKNLESLSDDEILQGFKDANARIVREYYYGYCRVAYCIYDKRYDLQHKPGMDFFSLAHEYYLYLCEHDFKPLEDRKPSMSLKTWMVNGFRFLLLDKLKEVVKEHRFESFEARQESREMQFDVTDNQFEHDLYQTIEDIGNFYYGRDSKNSIILKMLYIEGFRGKDVAAQLGISHSAVTQRCQKMMHDVVIPYFKRYFDASEYGSYLSFAEEDTCIESAPKMSMPSMMSSRMYCEEAAEDNNIFNNSCMEDKKKGRITPSWIDSLKENEIFVFGSNLAGMHGGGAARIARLHFGAVMGKGVGLQGQSYAIPTMQGGVETIRPYVDDFIAYAKHHQELHFLVTPIGCGIAGFEAEDIAPLFESAKEMKNISLPESFWEVIE